MASENGGPGAARGSPQLGSCITQEFYPTDEELLDFGLGFPDPCGSKGSTKGDQKNAGLFSVDWNTLDSDGELLGLCIKKDNAENQHKRWSLCFKGRWMLQSIALGRGGKWAVQKFPLVICFQG